MKPFDFFADAISYAWSHAVGPLSMLVNKHVAMWNAPPIPPERFTFTAYWDS